MSDDPTMTDDRIGKALRDLPRARASASFRPRVITRLGERPNRMRALDWRLALAGVVAVAVLLVVSLSDPERGAERLTGGGSEMPSQERLESLRDEYRFLEQELLELQALAVQSRPVVGVEGNGDFDFLIDLRNLYATPWDAARSRTPTPELAQPVSYRRGE